MQKLAIILIPAAVIGGVIGFVAIKYVGAQGELAQAQAEQLEFMKKQQATEDLQKQKARKMIENFGKALQD